MKNNLIHLIVLCLLMITSLHLPGQKIIEGNGYVFKVDLDDQGILCVDVDLSADLYPFKAKECRSISSLGRDSKNDFINPVGNNLHFYLHRGNTKKRIKAYWKGNLLPDWKIIIDKYNSIYETPKIKFDVALNHIMQQYGSVDIKERFGTWVGYTENLMGQRGRDTCQIKANIELQLYEDGSYKVRPYNLKYGCNGVEIQENAWTLLLGINNIVFTKYDVFTKNGSNYLQLYLTGADNDLVKRFKEDMSSIEILLLEPTKMYLRTNSGALLLFEK